MAATELGSGDAVAFGAISRKPDNLTLLAWRRFRRHKLALLGLAIITILILSALLAPWIARYDPNEIDLYNRSKAPSATHWLGTDETGRDVWARMVYAGRVSLSVGIVAVAISTVIGTVLAGVAGYYGGRVDDVTMRFVDTFMSFPSLVIIITLVAILGPSIWNAMIAIGVFGWPSLCRLVRSEILSLRERQFVEAATCLGVPSWRIIFRHIMPNVTGTITVFTTFGVANAILTEAALSFLGLGVQVPTPSWGNMMYSAQSLTVLESQPWLWVPPGVTIVLAVLAINFLGDGLRDALDPRVVL
jgi:peptide/nickel transport system permease protein